jgi:PAS domain-containing protein
MKTHQYHPSPVDPVTECTMFWRSAAVLMIDAEGRYLDADDRALELLGVATVDELRAMASSTFQATPPDPDGEAAFRSAFLAAPFRGLIGEGALKRLDGELIRVRTAIISEPGGGYRVLLYAVERPTTDLTPRIYRIADVLAEWRTAERRLVDIDPATDEGRRVAAEVDQLREQYQVLFRRSISSS